MARRKQSQPRHWENTQDLATALQTGISSGNDTTDDEHVCGKCRAEFFTLADFLQHKEECVSKRPVLLAINKDGEVDTKLLSPVDDFEDDDHDPTSAAADLTISEYLAPQSTRNIDSMLSALSLLTQQIPDTNVILEELHNTRVAVAQHGASSPSSNLAALQNALYTIQQQQLFQFHAIQELQAQILGVSGVSRPVPLVGTAALTPPQSSDGTVGPMAPTGSQASAPISARMSFSSGCKTESAVPPSSEPNTLELLQRHTEQALQNTMAGGSFLLNGIGNGTGCAKFRKSKDSTPEGHCCKFCGKAFGSDSALQIHVRSHTGERPFKCSVCGNSFTTRGNLKVHFQKHKMELANLKPDVKESDESHNISNGHPVSDVTHPTEITDSSQQNEKALDFSTSVQSNYTLAQGTETPPAPCSRSDTPNDQASNFSDDSGDCSGEENPEPYDTQKVDGEQYDEERASNASPTNANSGDEDCGQMIDYHHSPMSIVPTHPSFTPSPSFTPFFRPASFGGAASENSMYPPPPTSSTPTGPQKGENSSISAADPALYQDLLPRAGSNDNSWESLMEVTETSETFKLQQLVDNIENKVSDPNQCVICHRVLSCKSALQMHYRTHTGERPFKCKLCGRAFTTKGNLKTHMGVHRVKPASRVLHQCPVCHKQFNNPLILQQHIRMHTDSTPYQMDSFTLNDDKHTTLLPPSYSRPAILPPHLTSPAPLALTYSGQRTMEDRNQVCLNSETVIKATNLESVTSQQRLVSPTDSAVSSDEATPQPEDQNQEPKSQGLIKITPVSDAASDDKSNLSDRSSPVNMVIVESPSPEKNDSIKRSQSPAEDNKDNYSSTDLNLMSTSVTDDKMEEGQGKAPRDSKSFDALSSDVNSEDAQKAKVADDSVAINLAQNRLIPHSSQGRIYPVPFSIQYSDRPLPPVSSPNSISQFTPSLAALENQVNGIKLSHPLSFPSPFGMGISPSYLRHDIGYAAIKREKSPAYSPPTSKSNSDCSADERSTPFSQVKTEPASSLALTGHVSENGALDLTPKTSTALHRQQPTTDLKMFSPLAGLPFPPPHNRISTTCRVCFKTFACQSALEIHYRSHTKERPFRCEVCDRGFSTKGNMKQHMLTHKIRDLPSQLFSQKSPTIPSSTPMVNVEAKAPAEKKSPEDLSKRPLTDSAVSQPLNKRLPGVPKHLCQVCNKPFSSGSALQIHMRTHTGDKPFQCTICSRAFTTKGNLKVHMGTHMWNNSTSRRGRRMSLDISPVPFVTPKEYPTPRPDLFFPFMPTFMNGIAQSTPPHKMNEISVIQTAGVSNGIVTTSTAAITMASPIAMVTENRKPLVSRVSDLADTVTSTDGKVTLEGEAHRDEKSPTKIKDLSSAMNQSEDRGVNWQWKIACNRCNKICTSSTELEIHMKNTHYRQEESDCQNSMQSADKVSAEI